MSLFAFFLFQFVVATPEPLTLTVTPTALLAPATVQLHIGVPRNDRNRFLCWGWDSLDEGYSSCRTIDGRSPVSYFPVFDELAPGNYVVYATLHQAGIGAFKNLAVELTVYASMPPPKGKFHATRHLRFLWLVGW